MSQEIKLISREAADTSKGYTLQKLRTVSLILEEIGKDKDLDFIAAIEYGGDIYIGKDHHNYIEENKAYDSKNFSLASDPIKNTLVYFLDYWLSNKKNSNIHFGIFCTNDIAKENNTALLKLIGVDLPKIKIIESLQLKDYSDIKTIEAAKQIILHEYKKQYEENRNVSLENSFYNIIKAFTTDDWKAFFNKINWVFNDTTIEKLEEQVLDQIIKSNFITSEKLPIRARFIRAELFYELELRQTKKKTEDRFLTKKDIENIFYRAVYEEINEESYKYLNINYDDMRAKTQRFLNNFIDTKYFAITGSKSAPKLFPRDVMNIDPNLRSTAHSIEQMSLQHASSTGPLEHFAQSDQPVFLLGDLGSGKSTMAAEYIKNILETEPEIVPIFIPTVYLTNSSFSNLAEFKNAINNFINSDLQIEDETFDIKNLIKSRKETVIVIDGLDELEMRQTKLIINHLKNLKAENEKIRVIATGRPVELEGVIPAGWKILSTTSLNEKEILKILYNESLNKGNSLEDAQADALKKLSYLKSTPHLFSISNTPLVICSIYEQLDENIIDKSLGDILYNTLHEKLSWNDKDIKANEFSEFYTLYPSKFSKEPILGNMAWRILNSKDRSVNEAELHSIISSSISASGNKSKIVEEAIRYFKNIFLQETTNKKFSFLSNPLLECAAGIYISDTLRDNHVNLEFVRDWRSISFGAAISRHRSETSLVSGKISSIVAENLTWENHYVPQTAIIVAELKDETLCKEYFSLLEKLPYRPLKMENRNDFTSVNSYAVCIDLAADTGYEWFWNHYLNPIHPLKHYESKLVSQIFSYYLIIKDFELDNDKVKKLSDLIAPNIVLKTAFCHDILPILATISDFNIARDQYFQLVASNILYNRILKDKSKEILLSKSKVYKNEILATLESMCLLRETQSIDTAVFWIEINNERIFSKAILRTILAAITDENFSEYKKLLLNIIDENNLLSYLKYCCLTDDTKLAKAASLYLFLDGERDFLLIGKHLVNSIEWLDSKKVSLTHRIDEFIKSQDISGIDALIKSMPTNNNLGIPPSFWTLFLPALQVSEINYGEDFLKSVNHLSLLILTRQPEIRIAFTKLFEEKVFYKELIVKQMYNLDNRLRYLSASLLLAVNSQSEYEALQIVISGFSHNSDMDEWQTFVLELRYSDAVLNELYYNLNIFTEESKVFALTLLSRNNYSLNPNDTGGLVSGLLGSGYFSDKSGFGFNTKYHITLSQNIYKDELIRYTKNDNLKKAQRAASILKQFHWENLDYSTRVRANILNSENDENYFHDLTIGKKDSLFKNDKYKTLQEQSSIYEKDYGEVSLLWLFCKSVKENSGFDVFFKKLIQKHGKGFRSELDYQYEWLQNIAKLYPELKTQISAVIEEILKLPTVQESSNDLFAWLKLMESEFCESSNIKHSLLQGQFRQIEQELFLSLYFRGLYNLDLTNFNNTSLVFINAETEVILTVSTVEIERFLFDLEDIPIDLDSKMEEVLIFGSFTQEKLDEFEREGSLSSYFATVVKFVRNLPVDITLFPTTKKIGNNSVHNRHITKLHTGILLNIYKILISKDQYYKLLVDTISEEMESKNSKNYVDNFIQLLVLDYNFKPEQIIRLFTELDKDPFSLTPDYSKLLSNYLADKISPENGQQYITILKQILLRSKNHFEKHGTDGNRNVLSWILSLALLKFEKIVSDEARIGFLLGLQGCFLERNSMRRHRYGEKEFFFTGGDLLKSSANLLQEIEPQSISEIVEYGTNTNIPEIRAVAFLLLTLTGKKNN